MSESVGHWLVFGAKRLSAFSVAGLRVVDEKVLIDKDFFTNSSYVEVFSKKPLSGICIRNPTFWLAVTG
ncbi:MAG: hypothetical protein ACR2QW_12815 [bacterium]